MICVSAAVLLVAKGFVRLPRPRMLSLGRLALEMKELVSSGLSKGKG